MSSTSEEAIPKSRHQTYVLYLSIPDLRLIKAALDRQHESLTSYLNQTNPAVSEAAYAQQLHLVDGILVDIVDIIGEE